MGQLSFRTTPSRSSSTQTHGWWIRIVFGATRSIRNLAGPSQPGMRSGLGLQRETRPLIRTLVREVGVDLGVADTFQVRPFRVPGLFLTSAARRLPRVSRHPQPGGDGPKRGAKPVPQVGTSGRQASGSTPLTTRVRKWSVGDQIRTCVGGLWWGGVRWVVAGRGSVGWGGAGFGGVGWLVTTCHATPCHGWAQLACLPARPPARLFACQPPTLASRVSVCRGRTPVDRRLRRLRGLVPHLSVGNAAERVSTAGMLAASGVVV